VVKASDLKAPLPLSLTGPLRVLFWVPALALIALVYWITARGVLMTKYGDCLESAPSRGEGLTLSRAFATCLQQRSLYSAPLVLLARRDLDRMPATPSRFIGTWTATREGQTWRIELQGDGRFVATPDTGDASQARRGSWSGIGTRLLWVYDNESTWPPEANAIVDDHGDRFDLIEVDGSRTHYARAAIVSP